MEELRVRLMLGDREVFSAPLRPLGNSKSGKTVRLASDPTGRVDSPFKAFAKIGWTLTMYGVPHKPDAVRQTPIGTASPENVAKLEAEAAAEQERD